MEKVKLILSAGAGAGVVILLYLAMTYVTAAGNQTLLAVRIARRLGIKPSP
jgi:hypothetical protein